MMKWWSLVVVLLNLLNVGLNIYWGHWLIASLWAVAAIFWFLTLHNEWRRAKPVA